MSKQGIDKATASAEETVNGTEERRGELHALSAEIVDLFYTQTFSPTISTPSDVCAAFSEMLLRHWDLCCIIIYLRDGDGSLTQSAIHTHEHFDQARALEVGALLASTVESGGRELQVWLDESESAAAAEGADEYRRALEKAGLYAGVAVPIHARGTLVGALVAVTAYPERLRAALNGIRFISAPIVIAVGNARRAAALRQQHERIEHLIEELQQRTHDLEEANRELQRVARYRSLFLARMSHELRTPLTSILGFTEILLDHEDLSDTQRRFCEKIQSSGMQLQSSLNQLVDLSRLEAGQTELFLHEFSLRQALHESCMAVARLAQKQDVKVDCHYGENIGTIVSDEGKLRQVLYNFLAHAIGRSPAGATIAVTVDSLAPLRYQISIEDHGEKLHDMSRVFEPVDIDAPSEQATSMNELGLVIARRLIDAIGGTVELESVAGGGLKVRIALPARPTKG
ncbi:MAG TPA: HAMP domain-containing sensor histidine kinase [Pyrinomonadaceae bacterium]|jgi:signal transduction histidine kinase|nr:HAMP domain-containing sensor histidine kinase [Pyrinomonadaceae bacterium]